MKPTVGRMVHYTNLGDKDGRYPPEQQAAIITKVHGMAKPALMGADAEWGTPNVALAVLYPTGLFFMPDVPHSETYERGHWSWPLPDRP